VSETGHLSVLGRDVSDPFELNVASEPLRSCAVETADIGFRDRDRG
jgi:hypothetical protein